VKIPVQNVYYLLLYAWDHVGEGAETGVTGHGYTRLQDLFAHVLADTTARLLARGLDRGYQPLEEPVRGVRGKLQLAATIKRNLPALAQTQCAYDELRYDVLHNRILKATIRSLLGVDVDPEILGRLRRLHQKLDAVAEVRVSSRDFGMVQLHRNNRLYDLALRICRLIHDNLMIEERTGQARFRDFRADERQMGALFEEFVRSFYRREQRRFRVSSPHISWHEAQGSTAALQHLPIMRSDVVLERPGHCIICDTKFYQEPLASRHGARKVRSEHLYQILSYVDNHSGRGTSTTVHEGMLLYPVVSEPFSFDYRLNSHALMVRSINLDQPWETIRSDLLRLIGAE
jgi:5-methylcytosine-specific restriction enzyme subunit McrC